jgi:hypothetical protein
MDSLPAFDDSGVWDGIANARSLAHLHQAWFKSKKAAKSEDLAAFEL